MNQTINQLCIFPLPRFAFTLRKVFCNSCKQSSNTVIVWLIFPIIPSVLQRCILWTCARVGRLSYQAWLEYRGKHGSKDKVGHPMCCRQNCRTCCRQNHVVIRLHFLRQDNHVVIRLHFLRQDNHVVIRLHFLRQDNYSCKGEVKTHQNR